MSELSPKARDLFARARRDAAPTAAQKAALFSRIEARAASPAGASGGTWWLFGAGVIVVAATLLYLALSPGEAPRTSAKKDAPAVAVEAPRAVAMIAARRELAHRAEPEIASRELSIERRRPTAPTVREESSAAETEGAPDGDFAAELALVGAAQRARLQRHPALALTLLAEHERDFATGILSTERDVLRAQIACESGDIERGLALGAPYTNGAYASRIRTSCGEER
jgi:hypothetical protein